MLRHRRAAAEGNMSPARINALSDGVFAVALTLLTFDVVAAANDIEEGVGLAEHLRHQWPTFVAFAVGFMTILVCWINHHCVYGYVERSDAGLMWINGLQLALVSIVPFPTAVLAAHITGDADDRRTALLLYGLLFFAIATSFWLLWRYVLQRGLADASVDPVKAVGMGFNYGMSSVWTVLCLVVASASVIPALVMWAVMFAVFAFPASFAQFTGSRRLRLGHQREGDTP
jgi:uncharacterized membrane protein